MDFGDGASGKFTISVVNHEVRRSGALYNATQFLVFGVLCNRMLIVCHPMFCSLLLQDAVERVAAGRWDGGSEAAGRFRGSPQTVAPRTVNPNARLLEGLCHAVHGHGQGMI